MLSRQLCTTKDEAVRWIMAGEVFVDDEPVFNSGQKVELDASIVVKGREKRYASRGGYKLEGAIRDFSLDLCGRTALDAGASTGGFTDCLLKHGVERVYAVDAGFGQLAGFLRSDRRVVNMEKTNISAVSPDDLSPFPTVGVADLSYLSLKNAIPILRKLIAADGSMICLVKPLFETPDSAARRAGAIRNMDDYGRILADLLDYTALSGLTPLGVVNSHLRGSNGTIEFFLHIGNREPDTLSIQAAGLYAAIEQAVKNGLALPESPDSADNLCR